MKKIILALLLTAVVVSLLAAFLITRARGDLALGDRVAVVQIYGTISMSEDAGAFAEARATAREVKEMLNKAEKDKSVKAILLDINSPGGSVVASEEMTKAVKSASKPTVCLLGEMATSGAYYVASACDYIVAERATITGSIGVISIFPEYSRLLEKIGVNMTVVKAGEFKDFSTGFRPLTQEEKEMMEEIVTETYTYFLSDVAHNRNLSIDYLNTIAGGRVYTGTKAQELGLVDEVGDRERAIAKAGELGGIEGQPQVIEYRKSSFLSGLVGAAFQNLGYGLAKGFIEKGVALR